MPSLRQKPKIQFIYQNERTICGNNNDYVLLKDLLNYIPRGQKPSININIAIMLQFLFDLVISGGFRALHSRIGNYTDLNITTGKYFYTAKVVTC